MGFNFKKVKDTAVLETVKASAVKRGPRSGRTLENMLSDWIAELASDPNTVAIADTDGNPLVVCKAIEDNTIYGWDYESLSDEIKDKVIERATNSEGKIRRSHRGWLGVRNTLRTVAKENGLSLRFVDASGETADSPAFSEKQWEDNPTYGFITFRPYKERAKGSNGDAPDTEDNE